MAVFSSLDFWVPFLVLLFVLTAIFGGFKARALLVTLLCAVGLTEGLVVSPLKQIVDRPRPHQSVDGARVVTLQKTKPVQLAIFKAPKVKASKAALPEEEISGRSFPSGHAANNFAAAAVLICFYPRRGWWFLPVAALVSYSRIYTASHWPSDVTFSAVLGSAMGLFTVYLLSRAWQRWGAMVAPRLAAAYPTFIPRLS